MNKVLCFLLLSSIYVFAQPVLNRSNLWVAGESYSLVRGNAAVAMEGPSGASKTWDFSHLTADGVSRTIDFVNVGDTPYATSFPDANLAQRDSDGGSEIGYTYWKLDNSEFVLIGVGAPDIIVHYSDTQKIFTFPVSFGFDLQDTAAATYTSQGATANRTVTSQTTADGYGTVIMPGGSSYQVLRIKSIQKITDTISVSGFSVVTKTDTTSYVYYEPSLKHPLVNISYVTNETLGQITNTKTVFFRNVGGSNPPPTTTKVIPHITSPTGGFQTTLLLRNNGNTSQSVSLTPYLSDGSTLPDIAQTLGSGEVSALSQSALFGGNSVSYLTMSGDDSVSITSAYRAVGEGATCHVQQQTETGTVFRVYPGEPDVVFDGMALVNLGNANTTLKAKALGTTSNEITLTTTLAPHQKYLLVFDSIFPQPPPLIEITSTQPASAVFLRGSRPGTEPGYLYVTEPQRSVSGTRWLPHVTKPGAGFNTTLLFHNTGNAAAAINLTPYTAEGVAQTPIPIGLNAGQVLSMDQATLFPSGTVSHFSISGDTAIAVSAGYKASTTTGASAHFHQTADAQNEFLIYPGERSLVFDGLALVNTGTAPSAIAADLIGANGLIIAQADINPALAAKAKQLVVFDSLFPETPNATIRVRSTQKAVAVFLRGNPVGSNPAYLYTNPSIPQP
ncbi:MAG: hypothetical protein H6510_00875 [Acidobacteria bacterium]|nr:hypothetical protein [Acidobacteriota bacterium]MCB9396341.1 hypothetical protein [Acidobacteriota bacterium]